MMLDKKYLLVAIFTLFFLPVVQNGFSQEINESMELQAYPPLKSAAKNGEGPMALPYLRSQLVGSAYVFGSDQQDLFVIGNTKKSDLYLFKWLRNSEDGVPVFDVPLSIKGFFTSNGTIFQTKDNKVHALWLAKDSIVHTVFDEKTLSFVVKKEIKIPKLPSKANSITAYYNNDKSIDLVLELSGLKVEVKQQSQANASKSKIMYDSAGISTSALNYTYLYTIHYDDFFKETAIKNSQQATKTNKEVLFDMVNTTIVNFGKNDQNGLITGSKLGVFSYYSREEGKNIIFSDKKYMVDEDGNILRHPSHSASVCAYNNSKNKVTDIIAAGEGAVYYYHFTGKFTKNGSPIFKNPVPVLQQNADLYAGTLPVPTSVDWDGDGVLDLIVGNSEGFVLFFKNIGDNIVPNFLPGERVLADGKEIQIQAGYSGSIQGIVESRWGYASPNVVDWTGDGLLDIVMGDITGNYTVYINKGTKDNPKLDAPKSIFCDGLELHGTWRSRAAVSKLGQRLAIAIVDSDDEFHLYWKIDDYNVEDGGKLVLNDGSKIMASAEYGGGTGRCKLDFFDWDDDGVFDLIVGNGRRSAIPNMQTGYPLPVLGTKAMGTPLFMKNVGTNEKPVFEHPFPFQLDGVGLLQPGGAHECGAVGTSLGGGNQRNIVVGNEAGRLYLIQGKELSLIPHEEAIKYKDKPNPLSAYTPINSKQVATTQKVIIKPTEENVSYGSHERQVFDFYKADSDKPTPLVLWIHGGGWVSGSKKNVPDLEAFLKAGISVVSMNYRYSWQAQLAGVSPPIQWPIDDAVRALQFIRSKSVEWNINKERIAASGSSAGAVSSLYLALHDDLADPKNNDPIARESSRLWCVGVRHPQTSLDPEQLIVWTPNSVYGGHAFGFMDPNDLKSRDKYFDEFLKKRNSVLKWIKMYSPYDLVSRDDPDIYLYYPSGPPAIGTDQKDPTHTSNYGLKFKEHADEIGANCEFVYPNAFNVNHKGIKEFLIEKLQK
jgi:carboxylesterase type B